MSASSAVVDHALVPGFHTIHWSPNLGPSAHLPNVIEAAGQAGFELIGVDLATFDAYEAGGGSPSELVRLLDVNGLSATDVVAVVIQPGMEPTTAGARAARLASAVGAPTIVAAVATPMEHEQIVELLERALPPITAAGAKLAIEFGAYMGLRSLDDAARVCELLGWDRAGLAIDSYQCARAGTSLDAVAALDATQIQLVQFADASGPAPRDGELAVESRHRRCVPGTGELPLRDFVEALRATGHRVPLVAEVLSDELRQAAPTTVAATLYQAVSAYCTPFADRDVRRSPRAAT
jgi:sugar phosphate isomerase/epimerase